MAETAAVVIIGGGIMGASLAFALASRGQPDVLVLERATVAAGASGKTGVLLRQHYSNVPEATLAHESLQVFRHWADIIGGDCGYTPCGLIVTVPARGADDVNLEHLRANVALQRSLGIAAEVLSAPDLRRLQPFATFDDIVAAAYEAESGYVDSIAATRGMMDAAIARGARLREGVRVTAIETRGGRVTGVLTTSGAISTDAVVCVAGPWSTALLAATGVDVPVVAQRVQVAIVNRPDSMPRAGTMAYVDTAAGFFCRNWGPNRTLLGVGGGEFHDLVDPDFYATGNDPSFAGRALALMGTRMPAMRAATYLYGHAGLYDMTPDAHPIIGPAPGLEGLYLALGFSGAGFKKSPAVGQALARLVLGDTTGSVDLAPFRATRFADGDWRQPWSEHEYQFTTDFGHKF